MRELVGAAPSLLSGESFCVLDPVERRSEHLIFVVGDGMADYRQVRGLVQEVGEQFAPPEGPFYRVELLEFLDRQLVDLGGGIFDVVVWREICVEEIGWLAVLEPHRRNLYRLIVHEARGLYVDGVKVLHVLNVQPVIDCGGHFILPPLPFFNQLHFFLFIVQRWGEKFLIVEIMHSHHSGIFVVESLPLRLPNIPEVVGLL